MFQTDDKLGMLAHERKRNTGPVHCRAVIHQILRRGSQVSGGVLWGNVQPLKSRHDRTLYWIMRRGNDIELLSNNLLERLSSSGDVIS